MKVDFGFAAQHQIGGDAGRHWSRAETDPWEKRLEEAGHARCFPDDRAPVRRAVHPNNLNFVKPDLLGWVSKRVRSVFGPDVIEK